MINPFTPAVEYVFLAKMYRELRASGFSKEGSKMPEYVQNAKRSGRGA